MGKKPIMYCVAGKTSAGKDTLANRLCSELGYKKVISYTDAPIRSDQEDGREHWFLSKDEFSKKMACENVIAYTEINGNRYMATMEQIDDKTRFYIIDPNGIKELKRLFGDRFYIMVIYVTAPDEVRRERSKSRTNFDYDKRAASEQKQFAEFEEKALWDIMIENIDLDQSVKAVKEMIMAFEKEIDEHPDLFEKNMYVDRYCRKLREYFNDRTEEGRMVKHAALREMEYVMENLAGVPAEEIREMYNRIYQQENR